MGEAPGEGRLEGAELLPILQDKLGDGLLVLSVSHDDYAVGGGGVQNLISDEQKAAADLGWHYLHVAPVRPRITLAPNVPAGAFALSLRLDSELARRVDMGTLLSAVTKLRRGGSRIEVVIHHIMAHAPELLLQLVRAAGNRPPLVWAHDFFAACCNYTLLRNDVAFCGGPSPNSQDCTSCSHGGGRLAHLSRVRNFFAAARPMLLAPSEAALEQWRGTANHPISGSVALPHGRLLLAASAHRHASGDARRPLRIAHVGTRNLHKGWPVFAELAETLSSDPRYQFFHLGRAEGPPLSRNIRQVSVSVTGDRRDAMIEAVAENRIDVVVSWSICPETFCFAAYEAIAGGAFLLTHQHAGNVPRMLSADVAEHGMVLEDHAALRGLFEGGELVRRVAGSCRSRAALVLGRGTIGWLQKASGRSEAVPVAGAVRAVT